MNYVQCKLTRPFGAGRAETTSYLPERYAQVDRVVMLRDHVTDDWTLWTVREVGIAVDEADRPNPRAAAKEHRRRTGDSLPRPRTDAGC